MSMRTLAAALVLIVAASPEQRYFRYESPLAAPLAQTGQTCVVLDAAIFAHAERGLADLRVYANGTETPYALDAAETTESIPQTVQPLNAGVRGGHTVFDAQIPQAPYRDLQLDLDAHDFLAAVTVSGSRAQDARETTRLGEYTIFDFTHQKLGRSTVLHLPVSDFPVLHFSIAGPIKPEEVQGLSAARVRKVQAAYLTVAESTHAALKDRASQFVFTVPAHVPVDRVVFVPGPVPPQFSRSVSITVEPVIPPVDPNALGIYSSVGGGNLLRIHSVHNGRRIDEENLIVDAPHIEGDGDRKWTIRVENGDDAPIAFKDVRLEMRVRKLCFDGVAGASYSLFYGDSALPPPRYDYATLFAEQDNAQQAALGAETLNANFVARPDTRPFTEQHPALLWIALLLVIVVLGLVALRSVKRPSGPSRT
jgi:hypothetical protein